MKIKLLFLCLGHAITLLVIAIFILLLWPVIAGTVLIVSELNGYNLISKYSKMFPTTKNTENEAQ